MKKSAKKLYGVLLGIVVFLIFFLSAFVLQYVNDFKLDKTWTVVEDEHEYVADVPFFQYTEKSKIIRIKNEFEGKDWKYIVFPMISGNGFRVYVNERLVGQIGEMEKGTPNSWNYCHIFKLDEKILLPKNVVEIEIYSLFTFGIESDPYLTSDAGVFDKVGVLNYIKSTFPTMGIGAGYMIGLILIILGFSFDKKNDMYIHMGICAVLSSFFITDDLFRISTFSQEFFLWYRKISIMCGFAATYFFLASIELYSKNRKTLSKYSFWITLAGILGLFFQPDLASVAIFGRYGGLIVILNIVLALFTYFKNIEGKEWLLFPFTFLSLSIIDYVFLIQILHLQVPNMFSVGLIFINIGFGIILVHHHKSLILNLSEARNKAIIAKSLEEKSRFLEKLFDSVPFPVFYQSGAGEIITSNREFEKMMIKEKAYGKRLKINNKSYISDFNWFEETVKSAEKKINREIRLDYGDGEKREFIVTCSQISGMFVDQIQTGVVGVFVDITKRKEIELYLRETKDRALESSKMKTKFLASMSHEIRNPMTGIMGMIDILSKTGLDDLQNEYLRTIESCSKNLMSIINGILDISKIEAGKYEMDFKTFCLDDFLKELLVIYKPLVSAKELEFFLEYDWENLWVVSDENRLKQVIGNFMSNAIKFTEKGFIKMEIGAEKLEGEEVMLDFHVKDSGIGIGESAIGKIFESYEQESNTISSKYGGTGLGLAISRELVRLLGGEISVTSELGKGSDFSFKIRVKTVEPPKKETPQVDDIEIGRLRILLADDNRINRQITGAYLTEMGMEYDIAENGKEVIESVDRTDYDLILLDINMPVLDGFGVIESLRGRKDCKNNICVIAFTAHVMDDYIEKIVNCGFDGYVPKPFNKEILKNEIIRVMNISLKKDNTFIDELIHIRERTGMDEETFKSVFGDFKNSLPDFFMKFSEALIAEDFDGLYSLAHDFKSNLGFLGNKEEFDLICKINENCRLKDIESIKKDFEILSGILKNGIYKKQGND